MHMPVPSEDEVAEYYASRYRAEYHGESEPSPRRVMRAWNNGERIYKQLTPYLQGDESVFEIGAGIGCTVKVFETSGHAAAGIEPNHDFNTYSRERLFTRIENTNLYDLDDAGSPALILLIHVIEHFSSPRRALSHIHGLLPDGGLFYVECPNLTGPFSTLDRMFHYAHIYNFTPQTLEVLAAECGFELVAGLSGDDDPDIHMLFRKGKVTPSVARLEGYAKTVNAAVHRYNTLSYHLRPAYLQRRVRKLWSYLVEGLTAGSFVSKLLERLKG
ncbi:MAG: class I SAM-dependent methyltransferase [Mariprofundus sp.]